MEHIPFKKIKGRLREYALIKIVHFNDLHNFIPLYSLAAIEAAISDADPQCQYNPDEHYVFLKTGHSLIVQTKKAVEAH